jgi:thioredoxin reductase (NADPH)
MSKVIFDQIRESTMHHKIVIIGSGPAGLTAGIYAGRANLNPLIIEGSLPGGQLMTTSAVENWPGEVSIQGPDLMIKIRQQAEKCGAVLSGKVVTHIDVTKQPFVVTTDDGKTVTADALIVATGATAKKLNCPGEAEYWGKGVSTCATCDAPFYNGKDVIIVGGGNTAVTEAEHLSHIANKIYLVHMFDHPTATDPIKDKVLQQPNVQSIANATVVEVGGDGQHVSYAIVEDQKTKQRTKVAAYGVFLAIGTKPNTDIFRGQLAMDNYGYLVVRDHTKTSVDGVFAAGDVADCRYRQAITSSGVGCMAALDAQAYVAGKK